MGLIAVFVISLAFAGVMNSLGASATNNGGLQNVSGGTLPNMISQTPVWNGTSYTVETFTSASNNVTVPLPAKANTVEILTENTTFDAQALLQHSYTYFNLKVSSSNFTVKDVYFLIGTYTNSSALTSVKDRAINNIAENITVYSNTTNQLGKDVQMNINNLQNAPDLKATPQIVIIGNLTSNATGPSVVVSLQLEHPYNFNLFDDGAYVSAITAMVAIVLMFVAIPRRYR